MTRLMAVLAQQLARLRVRCYADEIDKFS